MKTKLMGKLIPQNGHQWTYCSLGGVVRVKIAFGEDIANLRQLDQKLWTVLSCPTRSLDFDARTLSILDSDGDGKIRVKEVLDAAEYVSAAIDDRDLLLKGESSISIKQFSENTPVGQALAQSAKEILTNIGKEGDVISIGDAQLSAEMTKFRENLADYAAWCKAGKDDAANIFPYGDNTQAAFDACEAVRDKIADYFMRCKLVAFNADAASAVDMSVEKIGQVRERNLANEMGEISLCPIARPSADGVLPFKGINPAWSAQFEAVRSMVLDVDYAGADGITEQQWNATLAKFGAFTAWKAAKKGAAVEALGIETAQRLLSEDNKAEMLELLNTNKAFADGAASTAEIDKFLYLYRDFYQFLNNYVILRDFYANQRKGLALFEAGRLFIDQRCCKLCIKVADMGKHGDMAALSGMFLLYCTCTSKATKETMDIVAVMTAGGIKNLRPGKNGVFYDNHGNDWDAVITKVVDNPINLRQAFWRPYRKFWEFCTGLINKSAEEKESQAISGMQTNLSNTLADPKKPAQPFDIAKFCGIFAAIGLALGYLGAFFTSLGAGIKGLWAGHPWMFFVVVFIIMLCISGPSCFITWTKLRKRNLAPVLNADGWAINSVILVNAVFGSTLTSTATYPRLHLDDPFVKPKAPLWKRILSWTVLALIVAFGILYFTNSLESCGLPYKKGALKEQIENVTEEFKEVGEEIQAEVDAAAAEAAGPETAPAQ